MKHRFPFAALMLGLASCSQREQATSPSNGSSLDAAAQKADVRPVRFDGILITGSDAPGLLTQIIGRLSWQDTCLVMNGESGRTYHTIWPRGTGLNTDKTRIFVWWPEKRTYRQYAIGDQITLPGGAIGNVDGNNPGLTSKNKACAGQAWAVKG